MRTRAGTQLMAPTAHRTQRAVEVILELGQLVVDVDVAFTTQPISLGVCRVDQPGGLGVSRLDDLGLGRKRCCSLMPSCTALS